MFDSRGSYIANKRSGTSAPIKENGGNYTIYFWAQGPKESDDKPSPKSILKEEFKPTDVNNRYQTLEEPEDYSMDVDVCNKTMVSIRQALL